MADWVTEETKNKQYSDIPGMKPWLIRDLKRLNILRPTPIQFACIPPALAGRDIIGGAKTGSGKTMAFVLPILCKLSEDPYGIFALVLTPTRELAFQIGEQFKAVGSSLGVRVSVVVGGQNRIRQSRELNAEPHIVVATPGRLYDLLMPDEPEFSFKKIRFLVLDEADRLLDGRFSEQLNHVLGHIAPHRQTLLFSATITEQIKEMEAMATQKLFKWESSSTGESTVAQLEELYCLVNPKVRDTTLVVYLTEWCMKNPKNLAIVFVDTCIAVEVIGYILENQNIPCVTLHSNKMQYERLDALSKFKSSHAKVLIATDLASRGLDIPLVSLVINHRLPNDHRTYLHRVGRTARAGRAGTALSIITPEDQTVLLAIEAHNPQKLKKTEVDERKVKNNMFKVKVMRTEKQLMLDNTGFEDRKITHDRISLISQGLDPDEEYAERDERIEQGKLKRRKRFLKEHGKRETTGNAAQGR